MENKLQKLTEKLYNEGLSKGKQEAENILEQARIEAQRIIDEANLQATKIIEEAHVQTDELKKNTATEISLAARQSIGTVKEQIQNIITGNIVGNSIKEANEDVEFVKNLILEIARNWSSEKNINLDIMLSSNTKDNFATAVRDTLTKQLNQGVEVAIGPIKSGFRISPKDGGYYVSFTDEDFKALISEYLRPQISEMLFGK